MISRSSVEFHAGSKEELLPDFSADFPYLSSYVDLGRYRGNFCPWHWHHPVELFYMESGVLEYHTPGGKLIFPAGSGGLVNSNVLHMTRPQSKAGKTTAFLHIFDPSFIAGEQGSRIEKKYILPVTTASWMEMIPLYPADVKQSEALTLIRDSFFLSEQSDGYELRLREILSEIWLRLFELSRPVWEVKGQLSQSNGRIKIMMVYVHEHYAEKISVAQLAKAAFCSERECFRVFHDCLHMSPVEYIKSYRIQMACQMLAGSRESVTSIGHACGLGSSSYFGKVFRESLGCTPLEYRRKWQDHDIGGQK